MCWPVVVPQPRQKGLASNAYGARGTAAVVDDEFAAIRSSFRSTISRRVSGLLHISNLWASDQLVSCGHQGIELPSPTTEHATTSTTGSNARTCSISHLCKCGRHRTCGLDRHRRLFPAGCPRLGGASSRPGLERRGDQSDVDLVLDRERE